MNATATNTKHTPGPWTYAGSCEPIPREAGVSVEQIWQCGRVVAEVMTTEQHSIQSVDEGWCNARLIAAAPELYAELDKARELLEQINYAFYVQGTAKALKPVMAETKPLLASIRNALANVNA